MVYPENPIMGIQNLRFFRQNDQIALLPVPGGDCSVHSIFHYDI